MVYSHPPQAPPPIASSGCGRNKNKKLSSAPVRKKSFVPRDDSSFFPFRMIIMISFSLIDQVAFFLFFPHFSRSPNANSGTRVTNFSFD